MRKTRVRPALCRNQTHKPPSASPLSRILLARVVEGRSFPSGNHRPIKKGKNNGTRACPSKRKSSAWSLTAGIMIFVVQAGVVPKVAGAVMFGTFTSAGTSAGNESTYTSRQHIEIAPRSTRHRRRWKQGERSPWPDLRRTAMRIGGGRPARSNRLFLGRITSRIRPAIDQEDCTIM